MILISWLLASALADPSPLFSTLREIYHRTPAHGPKTVNAVLDRTWVCEETWNTPEDFTQTVTYETRITPIWGVKRKVGSIESYTAFTGMVPDSPRLEDKRAIGFFSQHSKDWENYLTNSFRVRENGELIVEVASDHCAPNPQDCVPVYSFTGWSDYSPWAAAYAVCREKK